MRAQVCTGPLCARADVWASALSPLAEAADALSADRSSRESLAVSVCLCESYSICSAQQNARMQARWPETERRARCNHGCTPNHSRSQRIGTRKGFWRIRRRRRRRSSAPRSARPRRRRRAGARRGSALCYLRTIERPIRGAARARGPLCDPEASSLRLPPRSLTDCQEMDQRRVAEPGFALTLSDCPKRGFLTVVWHVRTDPMPSLTSQEAHVPALHW